MAAVTRLSDVRAALLTAKLVFV